MKVSNNVKKKYKKKYILKKVAFRIKLIKLRLFGKKLFYQSLEKVDKKNLVILIYWRWDFTLFVPNLNLTFKLVLLFMVFKIGQRVEFNVKDFLVLIVGEIYSLDRDEIWVPL